jgi:hypothetical protein
MKNDQVLSALWRPLFSTKVPQTGLLLVLILIATLVVILPSEVPSHGFGKFLYSIFALPSDVDFESLRSKNPFVAAIAYGVALIAAPLMVVVTSFTLLNMKPMHDLIKNRGLFSRVVLTIGLLVFLAAPYFLNLLVRSSQFSTRFFDAVADSRMWLLIWCEGIFLLHYVFWLWVFFEFTEFYQFLRRRN